MQPPIGLEPLAISPDGRRIAFTVERRGATQLYAVDKMAGTLQAVTRTLALRGGLAWAPDSQSIVGAIVSEGEPRLARIFLDAARRSRWHRSILSIPSGRRTESTSFIRAQSGTNFRCEPRLPMADRTAYRV